MRTTVTLEPDVHAKLCSMAMAEGVTLGKIIGDLVRSVKPKRARIEIEDGLPVIRRPKGVVITTEMVKRIEAETY